MNGKNFRLIITNYFCPRSETDITLGFEPKIPGSNPGEGT